MMMKPQRWFLAILASLMLTLDGLGWDAIIHSQEHGHIVEESLLNLSNPGHVVFGLGLILTVGVTLLGFSISWLEELHGNGKWQMLTAPAILWLIVGLAGAITLAAMAQTG